MVPLIVQHQYVRHAHEIGHDPLQHLAFSLQSIQLGAPALEQSAPTAGNIHTLAGPEGVVVGDDDPRAFEVSEHVPGDKLPAPVVAVRVVGLKHTQSVLDSDAGSHHQEAAGEPSTVGAPDGVDRLPGDNHRHNGRLAGAGGQLQCQARQFRVGRHARVGQTIEEILPGLARSGSNLRQPNQRLDRFDLAEEWPYPAEFMIPPMPK